MATVPYELLRTPAAFSHGTGSKLSLSSPTAASALNALSTFTGAPPTVPFAHAPTPVSRSVPLPKTFTRPVPSGVPVVVFTMSAPDWMFVPPLYVFPSAPAAPLSMTRYRL